jgi:hypothetical protein
MISSEELQRGQTLTAEQILRQVDAMRAMILQAHGGGKQAYERIRAADPLRRSLASLPASATSVALDLMA